MSTERNYMPAEKWAGEITLLGKSMAEQWKVVHSLLEDAITFYHRTNNQDTTRLQELQHVLQLNNASMRQAFMSVVRKTTGVTFKQKNKDLSVAMAAEHSGKRLNKAREEFGPWEKVLDDLANHADGLKSETNFKKAKAAKAGNAEDDSTENGEVKEGLGVLGDDLLGEGGKADAVTLMAAAIAAELRKAGVTPSDAVSTAFKDLSANVGKALSLTHDEQAVVAKLDQAGDALSAHLKAIAAQLAAA